MIIRIMSGVYGHILYSSSCMETLKSKKLR